MNPNYGYQLYQAERVTTRAQMIAGDAYRGRQVAELARTFHGVARHARISGGRTANAITRLLARAPRLQLNQD